MLVNGWQQGWVVPAGQQGTITLSFPSNELPQRTGCRVALLPLLLLMALVPARRPAPTAPARPWSPACSGAVGLLAAGAVIAGWAGSSVVRRRVAIGRLLVDGSGCSTG